MAQFVSSLDTRNSRFMPASGNLFLVCLILTLCSLKTTVLAQQWEPVKLYDFSDPAFTTSLGGVPGFQAAFYFHGYNGASGAFDDRCAYSSNPSSSGAYIAMQQNLEAGVQYRVSVNAKTTNALAFLHFKYGNGPGPFSTQTIQGNIQIPVVSAGNEVGTDIHSSSFSVPADGTYWISITKSPGIAYLDNFTLEKEASAGQIPSFTVTEAGGSVPITSVDIIAGTSAEICLQPDAAPASPINLSVGVIGEGSPHFPGYSEILSFPAGSTDPQCFLLSPVSDSTAMTYNFEVTHSDEVEGQNDINTRSSSGLSVLNFSVNVMPCPSVAGPDQTICAGESVQLGTGCLPAPHPVDGVEYCYAWEPNENLHTHLSSSMPTAFPTETTTYTVYVTDSNGDLIAEDQVTVNVNSIEIEEWDMPRICPGESVTIAPVIVSDGNYSYLWENGATTPTVEVELLYYTNFGLRITDEDTNCEEQFEFPVFVERPPDIEIISTYPEICELADPPGLKGDDPVSRSSNECPQTSTNLYAGTGIPGYSYEWSTGETTDKITVDEAGFYWVTVTKDGEACSATDVYEVGSCATAEIQIGEDVAGNPILDAGGEPGSTYEWHDGSTAQTIEITGLGLYAVTVTNSEGCVAKDGFIVKGYEYDPEDIFLVYYTQWDNGNNVDIYIQHSLQQGQDKTEYQEVIRTEVGSKVANLDQKNIRFFWNKKVEHQADITPVVRGSGKFFPMIIDQWPNTDKLRRFDYFFTPTYEEIPYKVKLDISHQEPNEATPQEAEVILDYATTDDKTIELGQPDFPSGYESLGQYVTAVLSIGKDAADGQSIEFDDPTLTMEIEFEPSVADPEAHDYKLYLNDTPSPEEYTVDVGSPVILRIKDETTGEFIKPTDGIYADFAWKENGMSTTFNFDQTNGIYDFTVTPSMSGASVVVNVKFQEEATNRTITFEVTMNVIGIASGDPGIYVELSEGLGEGMSPCPGQPCEGGGYKTPRDYVDEALAQLREDTDYPIYGDILSQIEQEGFRLVINLSTSREECELERGSGANIRYADSAFPSLDLSGTLKIGEVETWQGNAPSSCNGYDDCPKFAKLLVKISFAEKEDIKTLILNMGDDNESEAIINITESFPLIGAELSQWIDEVDQGEINDAVDDLEEYFEQGKLAYELTEANLPDHPSLLTISDEKLMVINLYVKALSFVPSYTTLSLIGGFGSGSNNADIWTYYLDNPDCFKIQEARQKKYKQSLAHELLHLDYKKTNRVNFARWQLIRKKYSEDKPGENYLGNNCSPGNDNQCNPPGYCSSFEVGHELGNDEGLHACQADEHYPNPEIQID